MSADWNTKYGTRRVRHDPPTLEEAIFAAVGITDDQDQQAEIAASLMGMPLDVVQAEVKKQARVNTRVASTRVIAGEQGAPRRPPLRQRQAHGLKPASFSGIQQSGPALPVRFLL